MSKEERINLFIGSYNHLIKLLENEKQSEEPFERGFIKGEISILKNVIQDLNWVIGE